MRKRICGCWPDGKRKAFTLSYDDGKTTDRRLVRIFNRNGLKATFHLNSGLILEGTGGRISSEEVAELYAGHEVAIHSLTHPFLERCGREVMLREVLEDRRNLEQLCGRPVRGMSYSMGTWNEDILNTLRSCGIVYSRTTEATHDFCVPHDFLLWHPTAHHSHGILDLADRFFKRNFALDLFYVWGHSSEFEMPGTSTPWSLIEAFCEKMSGRDDVWYATNMEIYDYITAQRCLYYSLSCDIVCNPSAQSVWLLVDDEPVRVPGGTTKRL